MDIAILAGVAAVIIIAVTSRLGPRWNVASPLLLVLIGIGLSFLPFMPDVEVEPEIILAVVLPPLLFSSAVNMPAMNFRREFASISGLAVVLVIVSSVLLGFFFHLIFPSLELAWCIALGAILSPTDAVATSIAKGVGISSRVTTILEGESLLNDATALVTLRTAVAAAAASFSLWHAVGQFAYSVAVAIVVGLIAGKLGTWARAAVGDPTVSTIISFVVPFAASVPTDLLGASGLVAAVVAGIITGRKRDRAFRAEQRISDRTMWQAVTLVLEGGVFLLMGLELRALLHEHMEESGDVVSLWSLLLVAAVALVLMILIRTAYVLPQVRSMGRKAAHQQEMQPRLAAMESAIADRDLRRTKELVVSPGHRVKKKVKTTLKSQLKKHHHDEPTPEAIENRWQQLERRTRRISNDVDYYTKQPLTVRDGVVMVAAGMRGAVTLAAAQTLPLSTPNRSSLILIAFAVAVLSLLLQGGTLAPLVTWIKPSVPDENETRRQRESLSKALSQVTVAPRPDEDPMDTKLRVIVARREALLDLRDEGYYDAECTGTLLASMDATELGLRLRQEQEGDLSPELREGSALTGLATDAVPDDEHEVVDGEDPNAWQEVLAQAEQATREAAGEEPRGSTGADDAPAEADPGLSEDDVAEMDAELAEAEALVDGDALSDAERERRHRG